MNENIVKYDDVLVVKKVSVGGARPNLFIDAYLYPTIFSDTGYGSILMYEWMLKNTSS